MRGRKAEERQRSSSAADVPGKRPIGLKRRDLAATGTRACQPVEETMKEPIIERLEQKAKQMTLRPAHAGTSELWLALPFSILAFSAGAALARLIPALRWESL